MCVPQVSHCNSRMNADSLTAPVRLDQPAAVTDRRRGDSAGHAPRARTPNRARTISRVFFLTAGAAGFGVFRECRDFPQPTAGPYASSKLVRRPTRRRTRTTYFRGTGEKCNPGGGILPIALEKIGKKKKVLVIPPDISATTRARARSQNTSGNITKKI